MLWKASNSLLENFTRCSINPEWDSDIVVVWWFVLSLHSKKCWDFDMTLNFHECLTIETLRGHRSWFVLESDMSKANSGFHWMSKDWYQLYNVSTLKFAKLLPTLNMVWESYNLGKMFDDISRFASDFRKWVSSSESIARNAKAAIHKLSLVKFKSQICLSCLVVSVLSLTGQSCPGTSELLERNQGKIIIMRSCKFAQGAGSFIQNLL